MGIEHLQNFVRSSWKQIYEMGALQQKYLHKTSVIYSLIRRHHLKKDWLSVLWILTLVKYWKISIKSKLYNV
jgi:hypothetical protein